MLLPVSNAYYTKNTTLHLNMIEMGDRNASTAMQFYGVKNRKKFRTVIGSNALKIDSFKRQ